MKMRCPKCGAYAKQNSSCAKCGNKNTSQPTPIIPTAPTSFKPTPVPVAPAAATVINSTYKVGDKVKVKSLQWYIDMAKKNGPTINFKYDTFIPAMQKFCGKEFEIEKVILDGKKYKLKENTFNWTEEMLES